MTTIAITKQELFDLVNQETVYLSDPVGAEQDNAIKRLAEVLPMTENEKDYFNIKLFEVGAKILEKIAPYTKEVDYPYTITDSSDPNFPDSIVYKFSLPDGSRVGVAIPLIQQYIVESLIKYIVKEWLKTKGINSELKELEFNLSLNNLKSAFIFGRKSKTTYKTL